MNQFVVNSFESCQLTGKVSVKILYISATGKHFTKKGTFNNEPEARAWVHHILRSYLISHLKSFLTHKEMLIKTGRKAYYNTGQKLSSLERCKRSLEVIENSSSPKFCFESIIRCKQELENLLPAYNNSSYDSSKGKLLYMYFLSVNAVNHQLFINSSSKKQIA